MCACVCEREFEKQNHPCLSETGVRVLDPFITNHFTIAIKGATDELKERVRAIVLRVENRLRPPL